MTVWILTVVIKLGAEVGRNNYVHKTEQSCNQARVAVVNKIKNDKRVPQGTQLVVAECNKTVRK